MFLAPWIEHGIFGGPEPQQVPHLIAKLGEVLPQVIQIFHRGLVCALHLLPRGGQVAVNQTTHDLLIVLIALLLQILPLLGGKESEGIQIDDKILNREHTVFQKTISKRKHALITQFKVRHLKQIFLP